MGLSKKTYFYSMVLAFIMTAFIILYFALMLPSLYVEYVKESNLQSIIEVQEQYLDKRNYEELKVRNPFNTVTVEIPMEGNEIYLIGKYFRVKAEVLDQDMQRLFQETKRLFRKGDQGNASQESGEKEWEELAVIWKEKGSDFLLEVKEKISILSQGIPVEITLESNTEGRVFKEEYIQIHAFSAGIVYEAGVSDGSNSYTNYIALGVEDDGIVITLMSTPRAI